MDSTQHHRARLVLLHGAGTDPRAFEHWSDAFPSYEISAPDLQAGLDVSTAGMGDYTRTAQDALTGAQDAVVCGWSMGGLIALSLAAATANDSAARMRALIVIEPSLPSQLAGEHLHAPVRDGRYHPDDVYGPSPGGPPTRYESQRAADQRHRGISVPALTVPLLVIAGQTYPLTRGKQVADFYSGDLITFPDLHHTALVQDPRPRQAIATWLAPEPHTHP